jgi:tetratricopeptide (TPR) repeat protein
VAALREHPQWGRDIRAIFMQLIRTRETEKITRKVQDEIMPQMMKLGPELYKNMEDTSAVIDLSEMEENPEWQERLESSGIADKMKELSQLQEDGGDIMMSTFSHLKAYPFFNELPNWFMPFHVDHTVVINSIGHNSTIGELISTTPFLCNSDKFSFALSMAQVPDEQRKIMMAQIDEQNINIADLDNASLAPDDKRNENVINKYIQDLYRFYKLFRRKGEFLDPFLYPINLTQVPVLSQDMADFDTLQLVGEFYFSRGYYSDAIELFSRLSELLPPDAAIYQKIGYCYQRIGNIEAALQKYEQAELLNADSIWLMKRMAACYKHQCNVQKALDYFRRIETKRSDDLSVVLNIGHCLCELGQYQEAIRYYYKVEFLDATSNRAWRPLAWCALLCRDFETSRKYYEKILAGTPTADDFLNAGHLKLAMGDIRDAMAQYRQSADMYANKMEDLIDNINRDKQQLSEIGVDITLLPLIVDSILYISDSY